MSMTRKTVALIVFTVVLSAIAVIAQQAPAEDERRAAIIALRAINTAEVRLKGSGGKYVALAELLEHPALGGVKADFAISGSTYTYKGAQVRLALSADATQYVVTIVSGAPNHTAAFSDERGIIYTGKALE